ncbi:MAG: hypothetical protein ABFD10_09965 [Prolixibacteraceae bacterium]
MRKKSGFTIVEQAIVLVPEFEKVVRKLEQQVTLRGQSKSTLNNYIRRFGIYNYTVKRNPKLQFVPQQKPDIDPGIKRQKPAETNVERFARLTGINPCLCPLKVLYDA